MPPGGTSKDYYWFGSCDHELCNGYAMFTWTGEDAGGHPINIEIKCILNTRIVLAQKNRNIMDKLGRNLI